MTAQAGALQTTAPIRAKVLARPDGLNYNRSCNLPGTTMAKHDRPSLRRRQLRVESLEPRMLLSASTAAPKMVPAGPPAMPALAPHIVPPEPAITASDVEGLLNNAARASTDKTAIIAVV